MYFLEGLSQMGGTGEIGCAVWISFLFFCLLGEGRRHTKPTRAMSNSSGRRAERVEDLEKGEPESRISRCMAVMQEDQEKTYVCGSSAKNNAHVGPRLSMWRNQR